MRAMRRTSLAGAATATAFVALFVSAPAPALAAIECPPGSTSKSDGANSWCEPSVCATDAQCGAGEVCKPLPLCVEIGAKKPAAALGDSGPLLMARQRCGANKACPASTTCLEGSRCVARDVADRMGLLAPSPSAAASGAAAKKSSCGCHVPGAARGALGDLAAAGATLAVAALLMARARKRRGPPPPPPSAP
jgi:Cys-rich repeat protein